MAVEINTKLGCVIIRKDLITFYYPLHIQLEGRIWKYLGSGNYNIAYKSVTSPFEVYKEAFQESSNLDLAERAVRVWNEVNPGLSARQMSETPVASDELGKPLTIEKAQPWKGGWVAPFVKGQCASRKDVRTLLIDLYNRTGRVLCDAFVPYNCLQTPDGKQVCIDVGMTLALDQRLLEEKEKSKASLDFWLLEREAMKVYFDRVFSNDSSERQTYIVKMIQALLYIVMNRPDILDVSLLKTEESWVETLSQAYCDEHKFNSDAYRALDKAIDVAFPFDLEANCQSNLLLPELSGYGKDLMRQLAKHPFLSPVHLRQMRKLMEEGQRIDQAISWVAYLTPAQIQLKENMPAFTKQYAFSEEAKSEFMGAIFGLSLSHFKAITQLISSSDDMCADDAMREVVDLKQDALEFLMKYHKKGMTRELMKQLSWPLSSLHGKTLDIFLSYNLPMSQVVHFLVKVKDPSDLNKLMRQWCKMNNLEKEYLISVLAPQHSGWISLAFNTWNKLLEKYNTFQFSFLIHYFKKGFNEGHLIILGEIFCEQQKFALLMLKNKDVSWEDAVNIVKMLGEGSQVGGFINTSGYFVALLRRDELLPTLANTMCFATLMDAASFLTKKDTDVLNAIKGNALYKTHHEAIDLVLSSTVVRSRVAFFPPPSSHTDETAPSAARIGRVKGGLGE